MERKPKYYIVEGTALPEIFLKVVETKRLIEHASGLTVNDAVIKTGISRSAYYKYKDAIHPFYEVSKDKIITLYLILKDEPGVLSNVLNIIARAGANILTLNQNIPINGLANITASIQTGSMKGKLDAFLARLRSANGVVKIEIMARE